MGRLKGGGKDLSGEGIYVLTSQEIGKGGWGGTRKKELRDTVSGRGSKEKR